MTPVYAVVAGRPPGRSAARRRLPPCRPDRSPPDGQTTRAYSRSPAGQPPSPATASRIPSQPGPCASNRFAAVSDWAAGPVRYLEWQAHHERAAPFYERLGHRGQSCPQPEYPTFILDLGPR